MSPNRFTPSSACWTTLFATRFTRVTGDCFLRERFRVLDFRALDLLVLRFRVLDLRALDLRVLRLRELFLADERVPRRDFFAEDFRALAPRFLRVEPPLRALDDRFEDVRPDFLRDDFLRVAIGQLLVRRVCTGQRKFHAQSGACASSITSRIVRGCTRCALHGHQRPSTSRRHAAA